MLCRRAEIPQDRSVVLRQQRKAVDLVLRPGANMRGGDIAHIVHVEAEQRSHLGLLEQPFDARQSLAAQSVKIDARFPIDCHRPE